MSKKPKEEDIEDDLEVVLEDGPDLDLEVKEDQSETKPSQNDEDHEEEIDEQSDPDETDQEAAARKLHNAKNRQARKERRDKAIAKDRAEKAQMRDKLDRLEKELARVKDAQSGWQLSTYDQAIAEEEKRINQIKAAMASTDDKVHYVDLTEMLADTKQKIKELHSEKQLAVKKASEQEAPKKVATKEVDPRQQKLVKRFVDDNPWFDANSSHPDCKRTLEIDNELTQEGYNPKDEDYWEELTTRLKDELPHRFSREVRRRSSPVTSTRDETVSTSPTNTRQYVLSRERKQAIIDAGCWDDLEARNRKIRAYQKFDKEERMRNL